MINIHGYARKLPLPHSYTWLTSSWVNTGMFSFKLLTPSIVLGKKKKKPKPKEPFGSATRFEVLRGLRHGSDRHLSGKKCKNCLDVTIYCRDVFFSIFHISPSYLKPQPPPTSESSVGGLNAGLEGKTHSNSPNEHNDTEINKLLFL